jgi:ABC-2 type transport system permease protein
MKAIIIGTYCQLRTFLRIKKAMFFAFFFPTFIYVIFSSIWGADNPDYQFFLLTGILVMATTSDALFSIGSIIIDYYQNGLIKFFKVTSYSFNKHILSLILSRIIIIIISSIIIFAVAYIVSDLVFQLSEVIYIFFGIVVGLIIFTLIGILVAGITKEHSANTGILNFVFFGAIFLSDTFYPLTELNPAFNTIVLFNPITPVLELTRGVVHIVPMIIWIFVLGIIQSVYFIKNQVKR